MASVWETFAIVQTELCSHACVKVHFRAQRKATELQNRYLFLNTVFSAEKGSIATRKFQSVINTCGERTNTGWKIGSSSNT